MTMLTRSGARAALLAPLFLLFVALTPAVDPAQAKAREVDDHEWEGVERVVALGDVHGDWAQYLRVLQVAGLVDDEWRWTGGNTHLVQSGDVPDRGPDTRRILDHLEALKKQAKKAGGRVHTLIGNHDAMNVYGDLRYVTPGEYTAFEGDNSERYREAQWEHHLKVLESRDPEAFAELDLEAFRASWEDDYPLGWVEHRQAWQSDGEYGERVLDNPVVLRIDDTLFVHGGLSAKYCALSLEDITDQVHDELEDYDYENPGMIEDEYGPLWYRGLAVDNEAERGEMVDAILERYGASRIVVGHTPTQGVVWPRFDGKVVLNDVGLAQHYGGHFGFLEIRDGQAVARYADGASLPLPGSDDDRLAYLEEVVALDPDNAWLQQRLERVRAAREAAPEDTPEAATEESLTEEERAERAQREAWLSPDNCR